MQQYRQGGRIPSVKELMISSKCFKVFFWMTIVGLVVSSVLSIVAMSVSCRDDEHKCSYHFTYSTTECHTKGRAYCCGNTYDKNMERYYTCHGNSYCYLKPIYSTRCDGLNITAITFVGLTLLFALMMAITCCCLRKTKRRMERDMIPQYNMGGFMPQDWQRQQGQIIYAPPQPQYYHPQPPPHQPLPAPQQMQMGRPAIVNQPDRPRKESEERLIHDSPYPNIQ